MLTLLKRRVVDPSGNLPICPCPYPLDLSCLVIMQERELALRQAEERMVLRSGGTVLAPVPQGEGPSVGPIDSSTQLVAYIPGSENAIVEAGGSGQVRNRPKEVDLTGGLAG